MVLFTGKKKDFPRIQRGGSTFPREGGQLFPGGGGGGRNANFYRNPYNL